MSFPLPHVLVLLNLLRSSRLSTRRAGRFGDERRLLAIAMDMRRSFGCGFLGSLTPRLSIAPTIDTDGGEGSVVSSLLASF